MSSEAKNDARFEQLTPSEAHGKFQSGGAILLDVRTPEEFKQGHVEGAINIPFKVVDGEGDDKKLVFNPRFEQEVGEALKGGPRPLVCACFGGRRGAAAATALSDAGFDDVSNLVGGVGAWAKEGRAVVGNVEPPFDHDPSAH